MNETIQMLGFFVGCVAGLATLFWVVKATCRDYFWLVLAIIFALPLERIPSLPIAGFTLKINHILGILLILFYTIRLLKKREKFKINYITIPLLGLLFFISLSLFQSARPLLSLVTFFQIVFTFILFQIIASQIDTIKKFEKIVQIIKISAFIVILFAGWQFVGDMLNLPIWITGLRELYTQKVFGFPRVHAFSLEPLYLGNYLFLPLSIFVAEIFQGKKNWVNLTGFILTSIVIFMTLSRGAILAYLVFVLLLFFFYPKKTLTVKNLTFLSSNLSLAIILIVVILSILGAEKRASFYNQLTLKDYQITESVMGRLNTYEVAWQAFKEKPLTGIGLFNYGPYATGYDLENPFVQQIVNNEYLEILAEIGMFGLVLFIGIIILIIYAGFRGVKLAKESEMGTYLAILTIGFVAVLVQYNFFSTLAIIGIWVYVSLLVSLYNLITNYQFKI
ncbi:hypothetical protein COZ61_00285 [Candidatus Berkelbacteria bacterium CG_4_8_14_3_um_filter_33_6]|uniref:O-antigen ligase-related domain-containing protein n=1 Tax=Candidatus Berkelbacteria bacterium CG_4_10_14_0_2_um_filter_35_9_33_12 TaxID=1974499 RepID=A0A2M7W3N4_9BACT|nr:MAG: hypothetical protein COX10_01730 [Candidatus Berkelbacteria bacterium CG23_combo_of_CG06-09_8_20_14_all_33_15]PIS08482.1 MAG: hypothetical protein COT76_01110 [Candidatus Berkelbacteria bacterium CG10_big_fil_rev_8_21_14_0_10_33_10]PIX31335.1 MAG: hypothetical protein COZ61_00285 [Candidatus Berkelbacteria bacterium CG_4_8_14_3_um_filter_33_6]PIZ28563.1 MAG: hypothetical protein COY43_00045 [Candidatus Berkelbacteria bacterium CG_4_10_14_0_8_um_filter_35_9_33_8]PJA20142.1 MAG: hypotheti